MVLRFPPYIFIIREGLQKTKILDLLAELLECLESKNLSCPGEHMKPVSKSFALFFILLIPLSMLSAEKGDVAKGKELFEKHCAVCHGTGGEGKEAMAKVFGVKMPVLGSKEVQSQDDAALKKIVLEGKGKMKPVALSTQEIENVIAFLRTLKK
jgi:mono/diheme cytochrome c family protein